MPSGSPERAACPLIKPKSFYLEKIPQAGSRTKKLLERMKSKGVIRTQMGLEGIVFVINAGQ